MRERERERKGEGKNKTKSQLENKYINKEGKIIAKKGKAK